MAPNGGGEYGDSDEDDGFDDGNDDHNDQQQQSPRQDEAANPFTAFAAAHAKAARRRADVDLDGG